MHSNLSPGEVGGHHRAAPDSAAGGALHSSRGLHGVGLLTACVVPRAALDWSAALKRYPKLTTLTDSACNPYSLRLLKCRFLRWYP